MNKGASYYAGFLYFEYLLSTWAVNSHSILVSKLKTIVIIIKSTNSKGKI